jgi:cytochrome c peroxidase
MCKKSSVLVIALLFVICTGTAMAQALTDEEQLGKEIFFDQNLSVNNNQACAACHGPAAGWTGPETDINAGGAVYEGSIAGRFGNRKPPSSAYATPSPILHFVIEKKEALFIGGNFWDGRATGEKLGNPAADQAQGPFLNPLEQALATPADVVSRVCDGNYGDLFRQVWGAEACDPTNVATAYNDIALSIAAYEASPEVNAFTSKYDHTFRGRAKLTKQERRGFALFRGKGKCHRCHISNGQQALFTDFTYDNLGVPRNPDNPFYTEPAFNPDGFDWVDEGLGGFLATRLSDYAPYADANMGKQKVPTLRNVGKGSCEAAEPENLDCIVKAYAHNGYFKSLKGIVHFYNTRDVKPECSNPFTTEADALEQGCWPEPEVAANVNTDELGDLGLSPKEEAAIVAFLKTLSDGFMVMD